MPNKSRHYILTFNNPDVTLKEFSDAARLAGVSTLSAQLEKGEAGTPHIQAYFGFPHQVHFKSLAKKFPKCHIETCNNPVASYDYCQKQESRLEGPVTFGEAPKPRKNVKGDTLSFNQMCIKEGPERMVEDGRLSIKQYKKIKENVDSYKLHTAIHPTLGNLNNEWLWGPSGTGKSKYVRDTYGDSLFDKPCNKWWDGYQGEETVLLDDFGNEHHVLGHYLKRWADHYPFKAEAKGTVHEIRPVRICVTSNYHPSEIWEDPKMLEPILRRFKIVKKASPPPIVFNIK